MASTSGRRLCSTPRSDARRVAPVDDAGLIHAAGKNALGLGPNVTALALGMVIVGTYYFSSYATKNWVMANRPESEPPKYFRDIEITPKDDRQ